MNVESILNMIMRRLVGRAVNSGVDAGLNALSGRSGKRGRGGQAENRPETPAEAEERAAGMPAHDARGHWPPPNLGVRPRPLAAGEHKQGTASGYRGG